MSSVNKHQIIGRVGRDPEERHLNGGGSVVNFSVATSEQWKSKDGEKRESTVWHDVVSFNEHLNKVIMNYVKKGSRVYVEGKIQKREYEDRDGNTRRVTETVLQKYRGELVLLDSRKEGGSTAPERERIPMNNRDDIRAAREELDDEIPW